MMEVQFRRALLLADNDPTVFISRPLTVTLLSLAVLALVVPHLPRLVARPRGRRAAPRLAFGEDD
jgi:putative tricarboxylic transport membrane protein